MESLHKRATLLGGLFVFLTTLIAYVLTMSPTVAFWDCGEYVASMHSLGVPHPPGNPLFILMGRAASILFFFLPDVGYRINLLVALISAATVLLVYLISVRALVAAMGTPQSRLQRLIIHLPSIMGSLFAGFGYTFWFSAVEQSECNASVLFVMLSAWIAMVWAQSKSANRDRLLLLLAYVVYLGIGVHMMSMLALLPAFLFVVMIDRSKLTDWRLWITCGLMGAVIYNVSFFLLIGPIVAVATLAFSFIKGEEGRKWRFCFFIAAFGLLGYSVHFYIPVRAALNPIIDENHPVITLDKNGIEWSAFRGFLERKQYGSESMITRMFHRRGAWEKQFGVDGHMGYGGFHITQFFHFGPSIEVDREKTVIQNWGRAGGMARLLVYLLPTFLMLWGWTYLYNRNRPIAIFLVSLFLITSVALVLYMNFADGFHAEKRDYDAWVQSGKRGPMPTVHREVRIRDYFFTPGFVFFGMWLGISASFLLQGAYASRRKIVAGGLAPAMAVLVAAAPALPLVQNLPESSRRGDWIPFDYAYNLLMSCDRDGVIFTNGDNDTFPLWALQEGYGIRKDVRIVNLSLVNTKWYIKQLKDLEPKVPISFTDAEIDRLNHEYNPIQQAMGYKLGNAGIDVVLPTRSQKSLLKIQDKMVLNIVDANAWRKPVYFAVTVSSDNMMGLQPYLQMQGLAYRIMPERVSAEGRVNIDKTLFLLEKVYRYTGLGKGEVLMNETSSKLMSNYAAGYLQIAVTLHEKLMAQRDELDALQKAGADEATLAEKKKSYESGVDEVTRLLDQCVSLMPWHERPLQLRQEFLLAHDRLERALTDVRLARRIRPQNSEFVKREAQILQMSGQNREAMQLLRGLAVDRNEAWQIYATLAADWHQAGQLDSAIAVMKDFLDRHPGDQRANSLLQRFDELKKAPPANTDTTAAQPSSSSPSPVKG